MFSHDGSSVWIIYIFCIPEFGFMDQLCFEKQLLLFRCILKIKVYFYLYLFTCVYIPHFLDLPNLLFLYHQACICFLCVLFKCILSKNLLTWIFAHHFPLFISVYTALCVSALCGILSPLYSMTQKAFFLCLNLLL